MLRLQLGQRGRADRRLDHPAVAERVDHRERPRAVGLVLRAARGRCLRPRRPARRRRRCRAPRGAGPPRCHRSGRRQHADLGVLVGDVDRAPAMSSSAWPMRPSSPVKRMISVAPRTSTYQAMASAAGDAHRYGVRGDGPRGVSAVVAASRRAVSVMAGVLSGSGMVGRSVAADSSSAATRRARRRAANRGSGTAGSSGTRSCSNGSFVMAAPPRPIPVHLVRRRRGTPAGPAPAGPRWRGRSDPAPRRPRARTARRGSAA